MVFAISSLLFLEVTIVGRLLVIELLLLALLPMLLIFKGRLLAAPMPRTLLLLGLLWLLSQVATDLIRDTPFVNYSRGWAKITFTLINFTVLYMLLHNSRRRLVLFAMGMVVGGLINYSVNPSIHAQTAAGAWKFGLAAPITLMMVIGAQRSFERATPRTVSMILAFAAGLNLVNEFRSLAGICFVTAMFLFIQSRQSRPGARLSRRRIVIITVFGLIGAVGFLEFYSYAASEGLLGAKAKQKYEIQANKQYGVLIGGRSEILVSIQAIADSPIIGHGSWAEGAEYAGMFLKLSGRTARQRAQIRALGMGPGSIPSHSFIFGAWVEAGLLGAVFWAYVLWLTGRNLVYLSQMQELLTPLIAYISFIMLWDVVFSPFGFDRRVLVPFYIIVIMFCWDVVLAQRRSRMTGAAPPP